MNLKIVNNKFVTISFHLNVKESGVFDLINFFQNMTNQANCAVMFYSSKASFIRDILSKIKESYFFCSLAQI